MKWAVLSFLAIANHAFASIEDIKIPELSWDEAVRASQTRRYRSPDGREWEFRFHAEPHVMPDDKKYQYSLRIANEILHDYEPKIVFASYDILRRPCGKDAPIELPSFFGVTVYLLTQKPI